MLQFRAFAKLAIGFGHLASGFVSPAQQVVGEIVGRVHLDCMVEIMESRHGLIELEKGLPEKDEGAGGVGFQQNGAVQSLLGLGVLASAEVGIAEPVIEVRVQRVGPRGDWG